MELLGAFLSEQMIDRIGWVLVHFLWQGVAIMILAWCILKILGKASSNIRYWIACIGMALMVLSPVITFVTLAPEVSIAAVPAMVQSDPVTIDIPVTERETAVVTEFEPVPLPEPSLMETMMIKLEAALPYCVIGWLVGVAVLSVWYMGGWCQLQKLRRIGTKTVSQAVADKTSELAERLGIKRTAHIAESALVQVPTVIGWLKPVILLPATALTGLDEVQLTAMIAHELVHIKRCDYLINIAQTIVEILGFYHPAVWWVSRQVRVERENCCDDMAILLVQNKKDYAGALFTMEAIRSKQLDLAVAANGGHLTNRISRLAGKSVQHQKSSWIPTVITILLVATLFITTSMAMSNKATELVDDSMNKTSSTLEFRLVADMTPEQAEGIDGVDHNLVGYEWLPLNNPNENAWYKNMPHCQVNGKVDLLVSNQANETMLADGSWGLEKTSLTHDQAGNPAVYVHFDTPAQDKFYALTNNHLGRQLAICIDGQVNSAPQIMTPIRSAAIITGTFSQEETQQLADALEKGMPVISLEEKPDTATLKPIEAMSALEWLSMNEAALPDEVRRIWEVLERFIHSGIDNDYDQYEKYVTSNMKNGQDGTFGDLAEMMRLNPDWKLSLLSVYWDAEAALAVTDRIHMGDSQVDEPQTLVFTLEKQGEDWLIWDVDLEEMNGLQIENARFLKEHPGAGTWYIEPGLGAVSRQPGANYAVLLPSTHMALDLITGKIIKVPWETKSQDDCLAFLRDNCGCGVMFDHDGKISHLGFINAAGVNRPTTTQGGIEMMSFESANMPQAVIVTANDGKQYSVRIRKAENEGATLEYEQVNLEKPQDNGSNLKYIGRACMVYANNHDGRFPGKLEELVTECDLSPKYFVSPKAPEGFNGLSYILVQNLTDAAADHYVLAYENPKLGQGKVSILFVDGHVEEMDKEMLGKSLIETFDYIGTSPQIEAMKTEAEKVKCMSNLRQLGLAWLMYADDNDYDIAKTLDELKPYLESKLYSKLQDHAVLLKVGGDVRDIRMPQKTPVAYDKTFLEEYGRRIVAFADGHVEIDSDDGLKEVLDKAIKQVDRMERIKKLKDVGFALHVWAGEHKNVFPVGILQVEFEDEELKEWALENVEYLAAVKSFLEIEDFGKEVIAYDRNLSKTDNGTNLLFADGHVEFVEKDALRELYHIDIVGSSPPEEKFDAWLQEHGFRDRRDFLNHLLKDGYFSYALHEDDEAAARENMAEEMYCMLEEREAADKDSTVELPPMEWFRHRALVDFLNDSQYPEALRKNLLNRIQVERPDLSEKLKQLENDTFKASTPGPQGERRQILTTGYFVSVPRNMPESKGIVPEQGANNEMIPPEQLETFLAAVKADPKAKILTNPRILSLDNDTAEMQIGDDGDPGVIKLKVKNQIQPDGKSVFVDVNWQHYRQLADGGVTSQAGQSTATITSGHAFAVSGMDAGDGKEVFLIQSTIFENQSPDTKIESLSGMGGGFGGSKQEVEINFPHNWDEVAAERNKKRGIDANENPVMAPADPNQMHMEIYDVADILSYAGSTRKTNDIPELLKQTIIQGIASNSWAENGGQGRLDFHGKNKLIIWQTPEVHETLRDCFRKFRADQHLLQEQLNTGIDLSPLKGGVPLYEAIEHIQNSVDPPLPIVVDWEDLDEKAGVLPTDEVRPGGYLKAPIQDVLKEIFYDLSYNKGIEQPIGYVVYNTDILIIANPHDLLQKTYTLNPELRYDESGAVLPKYELRHLLIEQLIPLMNPNELWKRDARDIMLDGDKLKVIATEQAHLLIAEKLASLKPSDLMEVHEDKEQISIEARFLLVPENFLEDIGLDTTSQDAHETSGGVGELVVGPANSKEILAALEHKPLSERELPPVVSYSKMDTASSGSKPGPVTQKFQMLDDLQVKFILRATQAHANAIVLTSPKALVLNGEAASMRIFTKLQDTKFTGMFNDAPLNRDAQIPYIDIDGKQKAVTPGITFEIIPIIQSNGKDVLLKGHLQSSDVPEIRPVEHNGKTYEIPYMRVANIPIHAIVQDRGTVLITGPELTAFKEITTNPGLRKTPIVGRHLSNVSVVDERYRLLILIKPTIIIPDEAPEDAIGVLATRSGSDGMGGLGGGSE